MNLSSLFKKIGLGTIGVAAGAADVATGGAAAPLVSPIIKAISDKLDPETKQQFDVAVDAAKDDITKAQINYAQSVITAVNATMQDEYKSTSILDKWRDIFGFTAAAMFALEVSATVYTILFAPQNAGVAVQIITALAELWAMAMGILGIAAWHKGQVDQINAKNQ